MDDVLSPDALVTFRKGELAYHPVKGMLIELPYDMIKIKGKIGGFTCIFFKESTNSCLIYENRPIECKTLECWNPDPLISMFLKDLLNRKMIFKDKTLREIFEEYDRLFAPSLIRRLVALHDTNGLMDLERKDQEFRNKLKKSCPLKENAYDALLGRPVSVLREAFESLLL